VRQAVSLNEGGGAVNTYTVLLNCGTIGQVTSANAPKLGYEMTVTIRDENGDSGKATGVIKKILEVSAGYRSKTLA
jgi:hypothetical protein